MVQRLRRQAVVLKHHSGSEAGEKWSDIHLPRPEGRG
jgi:hypothetical protein